MIIRNKQGRVSRKGIIVIGILIIILVAIFIGSNLQKKQAAAQEKGEEQAAQEKATIPAGEKTSEPATQLSQAEIEQIKLEIITGEREEVPEGLNLTKRTIIKQYLNDCYMIEDLNQKLECYELYFLNEDESLKKQKQGCEALSGDEKTKCLDSYYFEIAARSGSFCEVIVDEALRNECKSAGI